MTILAFVLGQNKNFGIENEFSEGRRIWREDMENDDGSLELAVA